MQRAKTPFAEVGFVEPGVGLLCQDSRDTLPIKIDPLVVAAVQTDGQVLQTAGIQFTDLVLNACLAVFIFHRRQRFLEVRDVFDAVALEHGLRLITGESRLCDAANERGKACAALMGKLGLDRGGLRVVEVGILELR